MQRASGTSDRSCPCTIFRWRTARLLRKNLIGWCQVSLERTKLEATVFNGAVSKYPELTAQARNALARSQFSDLAGAKTLPYSWPKNRLLVLAPSDWAEISTATRNKGCRHFLDRAAPPIPIFTTTRQQQCCLHGIFRSASQQSKPTPHSMRAHAIGYSRQGPCRALPAAWLSCCAFPCAAPAVSQLIHLHHQPRPPSGIGARRRGRECEARLGTCSFLRMTSARHGGFLVVPSTACILAQNRISFFKKKRFRTHGEKRVGKVFAM